MKAAWKVDAANRAIFLIGFPTGSRNIPPDDALDRQHRCPPYHHRATRQSVRVVGFDTVDRRRDHVMWDFEQIEEVRRELGQHPALVGNRLGHDHVVRRYPICGHKEEVVGVDLVDLADFARGDVFDRHRGQAS